MEKKIKLLMDEVELIFEALDTLIRDIKDLRRNVERLEELNYTTKD